MISITCKPAQCVPACNANQTCDLTQNPPACVALTDGTRVTLGRTTLVFRRDGIY